MAWNRNISIRFAKNAAVNQKKCLLFIKYSESFSYIWVQMIQLGIFAEAKACAEANDGMILR